MFLSDWGVRITFVSENRFGISPCFLYFGRVCIRLVLFFINYSVEFIRKGPGVFPCGEVLNYSFKILIELYGLPLPERKLPMALLSKEIFTGKKFRLLFLSAQRID